MQALCDQWGIDAQQATAFGDDMVDIGMMNLSGTGVAVANANPGLFGPWEDNDLVGYAMGNVTEISVLPCLGRPIP